MTIFIDPDCVVEDAGPVPAGTAAQVAELYAALAAVQAELPEVTKNRTAKIKSQDGGRVLYEYAYADLADVTAAIMPVLGRHGLAFTALLGHQPDGKFGLRYYLLHKNGARFEGFWLIPEQGGIQQVGGRITYVRRYILCALTGVAADEDTDANEDTHARKPRTQSASPPPPAPPPDAGQTPDPRPRRSAEGRPPDPALAPPGTGADDAGAAPDDTDWDTPGTVTEPMLRAIWTVLGRVYGFTSKEKDKAREVCQHIVQHDLETSSNLSYNEAKAVLDTLGNWQAVAREHKTAPRKFLDTILNDAAGEA